MGTIRTQTREFNALEDLNKAYMRLCQTTIVDDDYPEMRYNFENVLADFIEAMRKNGRFEEPNRYALIDARADASQPTSDAKLDEDRMEAKRACVQAIVEDWPTEGRPLDDLSFAALCEEMAVLFNDVDKLCAARLKEYSEDTNKLMIAMAINAKIMINFGHTLNKRVEALCEDPVVSLLKTIFGADIEIMRD